MSEPFIAEIRMWGCNFAPRGWAFCNGQLLPIAQNTALFSLIGTIYGGDGRSTFGLPNLADRAPIHQGRGPGLSNRVIGDAGGQNQVTLTTAEMPSHNHVARGVAEDGSSGTANETLFMGDDRTSRQESISYLSDQVQTNTSLAAQAVGTAGDNQPHENRQPYLGLNFCIALQGLYPPRS